MCHGFTGDCSEHKLFDDFADVAAACGYYVIRINCVGSMVREAARKAAEASGSDNCEIAVDSQDKYSNIFTSGRKEYVETIITAMAIGKPKWRKD